MSLANFFDKAALGASSILKNFDRQIFADVLETRTVGVFFDPEAAHIFEAKISLELIINLLARLYPRLAIVASPGPARDFRLELIRIAREINPQIEILESLSHIAICVVVGNTIPTTSGVVVYAGSRGWIARMSTQGPVSSGNSANPFGASAAGCIAVANVFRYLFSDQLENAALDKLVSLSLIDQDPRAQNPTNPTLKNINLGETHLVGIGAIGNGAVWVLRRARMLEGVLHLIDHESVELSNLQRYALATQSDLGAAKVGMASTKWQSDIVVKAHELRWDAYLEQRGDWNLERVAVAVDSASDRCAVQSSLPRVIANAWTRGSNLGISRHRFLGQQACLMCLYLPEGKTKNEDELIAEAIGIPEAVREVRQLLNDGNPVERNFIDRIAEALKIDPSGLFPFVGKPIRQFYSEAICGGTVLRLTSQTRSNSVEVPTAFQSALAGILLAAEIVIDAEHFRPVEVATTTQIDLLRPIGDVLSVPAAKSPTGKCICQDPTYISAYQTKYP